VVRYPYVFVALTVAVRIQDRQFFSSLHQAALSVIFHLLVGFIKLSHEAVIVSCEGMRNLRWHSTADGLTSLLGCYALSNALFGSEDYASTKRR
jgi:hypothetical protein